MDKSVGRRRSLFASMRDSRSCFGIVWGVVYQPPASVVAALYVGRAGDGAVEGPADWPVYLHVGQTHSLLESNAGRSFSVQVNGNSKPQFLFSVAPYTANWGYGSAADSQLLMYWHPTFISTYTAFVAALGHPPENLAIPCVVPGRADEFQPDRHRTHARIFHRPTRRRPRGPSPMALRTVPTGPRRSARTMN